MASWPNHGTLNASGAAVRMCAVSLPSWESTPHTLKIENESENQMENMNIYQLVSLGLRVFYVDFALLHTCTHSDGIDRL